MKNFQKITRDLIRLTINRPDVSIYSESDKTFVLVIPKKLKITLENNETDINLSVVKRYFFVRAHITDMIVGKTNLQCIYKDTEFFISLREIISLTESGM